MLSQEAHCTVVSPGVYRVSPASPLSLDWFGPPPLCFSGQCQLSPPRPVWSTGWPEPDRTPSFPWHVNLCWKAWSTLLPQPKRYPKSCEGESKGCLQEMVFWFYSRERIWVLVKPSYLFGLLWVNKSLPCTSRTCNDLSFFVDFSSHSIVQLLGLYKPTFFIYSAFEII